MVYKVTVWHGEHGSLFYVVDTQAPESEQPAVKVVCGTRASAEKVAAFHNERKA